ncbi:hypothetical protein GF325_04385 [Candidatus Bathyarchaeota archaeon]|nr:hypothetical protein [Candidatus Bathyarchaeota archaeon]
MSESSPSITQLKDHWKHLVERSTSGKSPVIFAHRGASGIAPGNTLIAFKLAMDQGINAIEGDVKLSLDSKLLFFHTSMLKFLTEIPMPVWVLPWRFIASRNMGMGQKVPLVRDVFAFFKKEGLLDSMIWSLDIRGTPGIKKLATICKKFGNEDSILVCNKRPRRLTRCKRILPHAIPVWSVTKRVVRRLKIPGIIKICQKRGIPAVNFKQDDISPEMAASFKQERLLLFMWNVHDGERLKRAMECKPDAIYSKYPEMVVSGTSP